MNTSGSGKGWAVVALGLLSLAIGSAPANAGGYPTTGLQRLLVIPMERSHDGTCAPVAPDQPTCPRYTAREWRDMLVLELNSFYKEDSWGQTHWDVVVLENPATVNDRIHKGWWPAPHTNAEYNTGKSLWDKSMGPAPVADALTTILERAIDTDPSVISLLDRERVLVIDNLTGHAGQSSGPNQPVEYSVRYRVDGVEKSMTIRPTVTISRESSSTDDAMATIKHELSHQLGAVDLYGSDGKVCPTRDPNGVLGPDKSSAPCVGAWDHMGESGRGTGAGLFTRILHGWVDVPTLVPTVVTGLPETVTLAPLEVKPAPGQRLGLRVRTGGADTDPFQGIQVECRRRYGHDKGLGGEGALVTYIDQITPGVPPQWVMRRSETVPGGPDANAVLENPGESISNYGLGVKVTYLQTEPDGACTVELRDPSGIFNRFWDVIIPRPGIPDFRRGPVPPLPDSVNPPQRVR